MMWSVNEILDRLEPVMPDKVKAWRQGVEMGSSPNTRFLIERHARLQFQKAFAPDDILLRPPPSNMFKGNLRLGFTMYSKSWGPFGLSQDELLQNLVILGRSGAGKTNVALLLVNHFLTKGIPFIFFDWKRTCRDLLPSWPDKLRVLTPGRSIAPFHFNFLAAPAGLEPDVWARHFIDTIARAYTLGDGSKSLLQKAITVVKGNPTLRLDIENTLQALNDIPAPGRVGGWKVSATRALESLHLESGHPPTEKSKPAPVDLLAGATVLELDALSSNYKKCLIPLLCLFLFFTKLHSAKREKLNLVVFVEEAHHLLHRQSQSTSESVMEMLIRQCREVGIALVVLDQHPHLLSPAVLGNSYCSICLNLKDPQDINRGSALSQLTTGDRNIFSRLPVGYGVVKTQDRWLTPFLVKFNHMKIEKGRVKDAEIRSLSPFKNGRSASRVRPGAQPEALGDSRETLLADEEAFSLLVDVLSHPSDGVDKRYKRLGWSCDKGNRLKNACLAADMLDSELVTESSTRRLLLRLTVRAKKLLRTRNQTASSESIAHAYWKQTLANALERQGFYVQVEALCTPAGRVDLLAKKDQLRLAVEIETGKSNVVDNVKKCLVSRFDRVVVAATCRRALAIVERQLAREGLIIPSKVDIVLAANFAKELLRNS